MASKMISLQGVGKVWLRKRRGNRHIRLSVNHKGQANVSLPLWVPYRVGIEFAKSKADWLKDMLDASRPSQLEDGMHIGKAHTLTIQEGTGSRIISRLESAHINVFLPKQSDVSSPQVQLALAKACKKALRQQAEVLLPQRARQLARRSGLNFNSVSIKQLTSRWGSCSSDKDIVLNNYLMQLPWELIDYVILHELVHTKVMAHGPKFWQELELHVKDLSGRREAIRHYKPRLLPKTSEPSSTRL